MAAAQEPRLAKSYGANVLLVVLTLFPGLINTSAISLAAPVIGGDLRVAPDVAEALPLMSDAALAFGCVLAAEMTRRLEGRTLYFWLMGFSLATSLASASAPAFPVLLLAHVVHGLVAGMLFIVVLPPLLTTFGSAKIAATATFLVPALFGAATLGPLVGGLVAAPGTWRLIFAAEVVVAFVALVLSPQILSRRPPPAADEPIDRYALLTSALGSLLIYFGVGNLAGNDWRSPLAGGPVGAGILTYVALLIGEARKAQPLVPVRKLATSLALVGTVATVVGSATFSALSQCFILTLLRIDGFDARATGLALWPEFFAALVSGFLFGRMVTTKWVSLSGAIGLVFIALATLLARFLAPVTASDVGWLSAIAAFGAGLSVSPGLFVVTLSFERALVGRAIALLNLFRLTGGFISSPGIEHTIGSHVRDHLYALDPAAASTIGDRGVRVFVTGRAVPHGEPLEMLRRALALGITDAYLVIFVVALVGIAAIAMILLATHLRLRAPDFRRFDRGQPALEAPVLV